MATRRERVVLELEDRFTPGTAKAAAQSELLARHLDRLDKGAVRAQRSLDDTGDSGDNLSVAFRNGSKDIDRFSGRLAVLGKIAATLGPALIPIGALGVPAVAGLASALGFSAIAAGTAVLAFQGVGEALDKVNKAALEPTEKNLQDARDAMAALSPAARDLVDQLHDMVPAFRALRDTAAAGLFPGLVDGLQHLEAALPRVERVIGAITTELGDIASDAGRSLASDRWAPFLDFIGDEAPEALADLASAAGDTAHGLAELWMAFDPLNDDFTRWVRRAADDFDRWASQLSQTQGFAEFVDYIREVGPQVGDTLSAVGNALLQIAEAAAPLGGPTLHIIEALAKAIAAIADSDLGTPIFALISAGVAAKSIANLAGSVGRLGKETLTTEKGLSRFVGFLGGPWGIALTAAGLGLGMFLKSQAEAKARVDALRESLDQQTGAITDNTREAAARALESQGALQAAEQLGIGLDTLTDAALGNDAAMASVKDRIKAVGDQMEQGLVPNTVKTREAVQKLKHGITQGNGELREATAEQRRVAKAAGATSKQLDHQRAAQEKLRQATNAAREAARKEGAQWLAFGDNLDDTKVSLDSWIKSLQEQADALNNFTSNALKAANKGLRRGLIDALEKAGPAGALRMKQLANATDAEIRRANRAWASGQRAVTRYARMKVPPKQVRVDISPAEAAIQRLIRKLNNISDETVRVTTVFGTAGAQYNTRAPGGKYATGGYTGRGSKYEPAGVVHRGEYVFSAEATRGRERELDQLHRTLRGYAGGGLVGGRSAPVSLGIDYDRLAAAMARRGGGSEFNFYTFDLQGAVREARRQEAWAGDV